MTIKLQTAKVLQTRIDTFGKTVLATQQEAHDIGVQVLAHYAEHGDLTLYARFVGAKIGSRKKGERKFTITDDFPGVCGTLRKNIVLWAAKFSDLRFNGDGMLYRMNRKSESFIAFHATIGGKLSKAGQAVDVDTAADNPWWTLDGARRDASRNAIDLLNLFAIVDSIPKRIESAMEADAEREPGDESHAYVPEQLDAMREFAEAVEAAKAAFIKRQHINVVELKAERELRKAKVSAADVARPVTTGAAAAANDGVDRSAGAVAVAG